MDVREYLEILHTAEKLKDATRHCTTSQGRTESVAEHSWRMSLMALLLHSEFADVNMDKVVKMCVIHDLGECFTGDIAAFIKTDDDRKTEDELLQRWVGSMPREVSALQVPAFGNKDRIRSPGLCFPFDPLAVGGGDL